MIRKHRRYWYILAITIDKLVKLIPWTGFFHISFHLMLAVSLNILMILALFLGEWSSRVLGHCWFIHTDSEQTWAWPVHSVFHWLASEPDEDSSSFSSQVCINLTLLISLWWSHAWRGEGSPTPVCKTPRDLQEMNKCDFHLKDGDQDQWFIDLDYQWWSLTMIFVVEIMVVDIITLDSRYYT